MSIWQEPKTDWNSTTSSPVGDDFNRIENNILFNNIVNSIEDIDGNAYKTTVINGQAWTADNWASTKYSDGTPIPQIQDGGDWLTDTAGAYCNYNGITKYGLLYNWFVVDPANINKIAPEGWRVPTNSDIQNLVTYLIGNGYNYDNTVVDNKIGMAAALDRGWADLVLLSLGEVGHTPELNNQSRLSIMPSGLRFGSALQNIQLFGAIWTSDTDASTPFNPVNGRVAINENNLLVNTDYPKNTGLSIKLVRDL